MIAEKNLIKSTIVLTSQKTENNDRQWRICNIYRTIGKMHPTLNKQVSDNLLLFTITQKRNIDMSIIYKENYCRSNLLEELLGKGLKYTMVKCYRNKTSLLQV
jgi:hypothetical protein